MLLSIIIAIIAIVALTIMLVLYFMAQKQFELENQQLRRQVEYYIKELKNRANDKESD